MEIRQPSGSLPHSLRLEARSRLQISGVTEVESFDEETVVLQTSLGALCIQGDGLKMQELSLGGGEVAVTGHISALRYAEETRSGGFFARLFG